jgi:NhaP-type Na+/H+ or K+/H+ antiporter
VWGIITCLGLLVVYITGGSYMESKHFAFGHETGFIIVIGALVPIFYLIINGMTSLSKFAFDPNLLFNYFLPLIIYATGFNIRRKNFFGNITNIATFGLLGTVLTFIFYSGLTFLLFKIFNGSLKT